MMRRNIIIAGLFFGMLCLVGSSLWFFTGNHLEKDSTSQVNRHVSYTIAMKNKGNKALESVEIFIRGPNRNTFGQRCTDLRANLPYELSMDKANNQSLVFRFTHLPPFSTKIIRVDADLSLRQVNETQKHEENLQKFLAASPYIELSHPALRELATRLAAKTRKETAKNIFDWVSQHITKTPYNKQPKGALYTLKKKAGDCTEFMHLFVALCRLNDIPTRCINGYVIDKDTHLRANDLHDWAQVYLGDKWYLADPFYRRFIQDEGLYVAMYVQPDFAASDEYYRWQTNVAELNFEMVE